MAFGLSGTEYKAGYSDADVGDLVLFNGPILVGRTFYIPRAQFSDHYFHQKAKRSHLSVQYTPHILDVCPFHRQFSFA